jgi:hypothetical protein
LWVIAWLALSALPLGAQEGAAEVRGRVLDAGGGAVPGVTVMVRNQDTGLYRQTVASKDGTFFLAGVTPGSYDLTAELAGFKKYVRHNVRLEIGKTTSLDVSLEIGGLEEEVTVTAEAPLVDVTSKEVGGNITSRELTDLPSVNRNFIGFIGLLPGIIPTISTESFGSDSINANGQDSRNNNYLLDGGNNNDDVIGQRAGTQARTPIEAVQEFQVLTSQFDAEFGRTTGAVINAVTKQGTNALRGSLFGYLQDASFTSKDHFVEKNPALKKPETRFVQYGLTLGGPLVRDRAHFFVSLERVANDRGTTIVIPSRPELNATPTTEDRVWNTLVRFDHQWNAANTWNVRWLRESSPQSNQIVPLNNRPVTLEVRQHAPQHAAPGVHARRRGFRDARLQRERARPGRAAADLALRHLRGPAEQRGPGARQRRLAVRRHVLVVHPVRQGRPQPAPGGAIRVHLGGLQRPGQPERHLHVPGRPALRCERPAQLPRAPADPCAGRAELPPEGVLLLDLPAG